MANLDREKLRQVIYWRLGILQVPSDPRENQQIKQQLEQSWKTVSKLLMQDNQRIEHLIDLMFESVIKPQAVGALRWKLNLSYVNQEVADNPQEFQSFQAGLKRGWDQLNLYLESSGTDSRELKEKLAEQALDYFLKLAAEQDQEDSAKTPNRQELPTSQWPSEPNRGQGDLAKSSGDPVKKAASPRAIKGETPSAWPKVKEVGPDRSGNQAYNPEKPPLEPDLSAVQRHLIGARDSQRSYDETLPMKDSNKLIRQTSPHENKAENVPPAHPARWQYLPVADTLDKHEDATDSELKIAGQLKLHLSAARVRGKKHKHDGTNCDDWFAVEQSGPWTIIAVADGAGSKPFSRVGAQAACEAVTGYLKEQLGNHRLKTRNWREWTSFQNPQEYYKAKDLNKVREVLSESVRQALKAVNAAWKTRLDMPEYRQVLGRELQLEDLYSTLLVTVHSEVPTTDLDDKPATYSLVFSLAIGDGMITVIDKKGLSHLQMTPDSGEYSGQVEFLREKMLSDEEIQKHTKIFFGTLRALMLMTDGVADDYYPHQPGMSRLYGDLVLNGVLNVGQSKLTTDDINFWLPKIGLSDPDELKTRLVAVPGWAVSAEPSEEIHLRSVKDFADRSKLSLEEVVASPELLALGNVDAKNYRLKIWLDSYQVRGSFDDRTLVVLYREIL